MGLAQRLAGKRIRMIAPYDEERNAYWLPPRVMGSIRSLSDWLELGDTPMLPRLDDVTSLGVLLLFERVALLEVSESSIQQEQVLF